MSDIELIRRITDAQINLELIDNSFIETLKSRNPIYVKTGKLKSSNNMLVSYYLDICQGISFLDYRCKAGAFAHNPPSFDPYYFLTGKWKSSESIEDPKEIFDYIGEVLALHMYHQGRHEFPEVYIEGALGTIGIKKVVHIPIKSREQGKCPCFHIAHDVRNCSVFIFPTDFDFGIKYSPDRDQ